eukprot:m.50223 g.50223  ORF g.50223 m.50223 type:complete len:358 (-) comp11563_c0_seq1:31-1104(-)
MSARNGALPRIGSPHRASDPRKLSARVSTPTKSPTPRSATTRRSPALATSSSTQLETTESLLPRRSMSAPRLRVQSPDRVLTPPTKLIQPQLSLPQLSPPTPNQRRIATRCLHEHQEEVAEHTGASEIRAQAQAEFARAGRVFASLASSVPTSYRSLLSDVRDAYASYIDAVTSSLVAGENVDLDLRDEEQSSLALLREHEAYVADLQQRLQDLKVDTARIQRESTREAAAAAPWTDPLFPAPPEGSLFEHGVCSDIQALQSEILDIREEIESVHARRRATCQPAAVALWLIEAVEEAQETVADLRKQRELVTKDIAALDAQLATHTLDTPLPVHIAAMLADLEPLRPPPPPPLLRE